MIKLIENHPLNKLPVNDNSTLVNKIKEKFPQEEQQLFIANFYCYLNYDTKKDFIIDLDNVWKWIGFERKGKAKELLVNNFKENEDYIAKELASPDGEASLQHGGQNRETILLTIHCFKKLCLKTKTKKSDEIHDYYLSLENIINEVVYEQSEQLRNQLTIKNKEILTIKEKTLVSAYNEKPTVYIILVEENIVKFGFSNHLENRLGTHKREIGNHISLNYVIESLYNREIETMIKQKLYNKIISKEYSGKLQTELLQLDQEYNIEKFYNDVITYKESLSNSLSIVKLLEENEKLRKENEELRGKVTVTKVIKEEKIPENILTFLENFTLNKSGVIDISNDELYGIYSQFSGVDTESRKMFSDKLLYCPHITTSRITIDQNDENYVQGSDNRIGSKKIKVDLVKEWITVEKNKEPVEKIKVIENALKIKKRGDPEKYFDMFLKQFIIKDMTIDSNELLEKYKKYISTNKTCVNDVYPDTQFNRKMSEKPFVKNIRIYGENTRMRKTSRIIDFELFSKQFI
jgi:uncharacterized protein YerC